MKNKIITVFLAGIILRFFLMSFFYHPDLKSQYFHAQFLPFTSNIYSYISSHLGQLPYKDTFNYPPLTYFFLGNWSIVTHLFLGPDLISWLNNWSNTAIFNSNIPLYLFWLKIPYFTADIILFILLIKYLANKPLTALIWAFNPISLYAIYAIGQFDILPALLTFIAYLLATHRRIALSIICLSLAIAFKTYPLFLLPFILFRSRDFKQFFLSGFTFVFIFSLWALPFIKTPEFITSVFQSSLGQRLFIAGIDIGFGEKLPLFFILYAIVLALSWRNRQRLDLLPEFLFTTTAILALGHFHAQWAVWSIPFWFVFLAKNPQYLLVSLFSVIFYFLVLLLLADQYVLVGLFTPLNPNLITIPPLTDLLKNNLDYLFIQGSAHALLTGSLSYLVVKSYEK